MQEVLVLSRPIPVHLQLIPVKIHPFEEKTQRPRWEMAGDFTRTITSYS